jgi:nitrate/nitrite transporter NarK
MSTRDARLALWLSTIAFTVCFAVWTIFSIIGVQIKNDLGRNDTQFGLLVGTPILTGSLIRLMLGIWTDQYGGRIVYTAVMLSAAIATWLLTFAYDYPTFLLAALGVGIAGGAFAVGIAYVSKVVPDGEAGHRARHLRCRQCGRCRHQIHRPVRHGRLRLADGCQHLGSRNRRDGSGVLVRDQGRATA